MRSGAADESVKAGLCVAFRLVGLRLMADQSALRVVLATGLTAILAWSLSASGSWASDNQGQYGAVKGRVVDEHDQPVSNVSVSARPDDLKPHIGRIPMTTTDEQGVFILDYVPEGYVTLDTSKQEDGYPNTAWGAIVDCDRATLPQVAVAAGQVSNGVVIRLGPKVGRVIGTVVDQATGQPVTSARWKLWRGDVPEVWVSSSVGEHGEFAVALPGCPYIVEVTAPTFKQWRSDDDPEQLPSRYIALSSHETLRLTVRLQPE